MAQDWVEDVLRFWFEELTQEDWFETKEATDQAIRDRFLNLHTRLAERLPPEVETEPRAALAAIIVLDQFSRNAYRKTPRAFATDALAAAIAHKAIDAGFDGKVGDDERHFFYMPLMHSENLDDQHRCVALFESQGNDNALKYAREHRDVVARFGRFPHRNRTLGRDSTEDELDYLKSANSYGQ